LADAGTEEGLSEAESRWNGRLEIAIAVALGLAAIVTALTVLLIDNHDDKAMIEFNRGIASVTEATGNYVQGSTQQSADEALFTEYLKVSQNSPGVAQYLLQDVMRDQLRKSVVWWSNSPYDSPFIKQNPFYEQPETERAEELTAQAASQFDEAEDEQEAGDLYILVGVIVSAALFLYGIAGVTRRFPIRVGTFAAGTLVFIFALGLLVVG
jgi:hypothetical protein